MSKNVWRRYAMHLLGDSKNASAKKAWIGELKKTDLSPLLEILETTETMEKAGEREKYWILLYLSEGANLLNISKTGKRQPLIVSGSGDIAQIAEGLKITEGAVLSLIHKKDLPAHKVGKEWVVEQEEFDRWLLSKRNDYLDSQTE
jgi:excisionase family DNA binding protein